MLKHGSWHVDKKGQHMDGGRDARAGGRKGERRVIDLGRERGRSLRQGVQNRGHCV